MELFLNIGLAWISVILAALLSVIYIFRIAMKRSSNCKKLFKNINKKLRKYHKYLGAILIATGLIHGLFSSQSLLSFNPGTLTWLLSVILGLNWMFRKHFKGKKGWLYYHRIVTLAFIALLVIHIISVDIQLPRLLFSPSDNNTSPSEIVIEDKTTIEATDTAMASINKQYEGVELKDGVFEGEATGYNPGLKVRVEVKNNSIISIVITEHNELNSRYYSKATNKIPQDIIDSQSLNVDAVSGATKTSTGIINAVTDALSHAVISGNLP